MLSRHWHASEVLTDCNLSIVIQVMDWFAEAHLNFQKISAGFQSRIAGETNLIIQT